MVPNCQSSRYRTFTVVIGNNTLLLQAGTRWRYWSQSRRSLPARRCSWWHRGLRLPPRPLLKDTSPNAVCGPRRPDPGSVRVALHTSARIRRAADQRDGYAATWIREFQETDCRCFGMGRASFLRVAPESDETRSETSLKTSWVRKPKHPAVPPQFHDFYSCACGPTAHAC